MISVSQQQSPRDVSIDEIPVDIANTQSGDVHASDVPEEIQSLARALASAEPPTNPLVVLKTALWWYLHGKGGTDPAFQWAVEWGPPPRDRHAQRRGSVRRVPRVSRHGRLRGRYSRASIAFLEGCSSAPEGCGEF